MKKAFKLFILLSLCCFLIAGCTSNWTKDNGGVAIDNEIKAMFENNEYVSGYNYFYTTSYRDDYPQAIVGIVKDYELVKNSSGLHWTSWQQFEPGNKKLKELVDLMGITTSYGFIIYAPGGEDQIGIMYSMRWYNDMPEIQFKDGNLIVVKPRRFELTSSGAP